MAGNYRTYAEISAGVLKKKKDKWAELNLKMALGHFAVSGKFSGSGKSGTEVPQNLWLPSNRWK